ncbi:YibE/F family protein [Candidatus Peregrinibacteria bacterium]|nr:YibE/F family protein [Candidatus Peregrinibacteria bacterium]
MKIKKLYYIYGLFWIIAAVFVTYYMFTPSINTDSNIADNQGQYIKGQIVEIENDAYTVHILDGGKNAVKINLSDLYFNEDYKKGDKVSLYLTHLEDGNIQYDIADYYHMNGLIFVFVIFCLLALLIARKKGLFSILSVVISLGFFYLIILNSVKIGSSLILAGLVYVFLITILTIPLIHGFNKKSLSAIFAVNIGYVIGFIITYVFTNIVQIGNTPSEEFRILFSQFPEVDIRQVLIVSLFIGAVGALIDVAITICSAIFEGMKDNPELNFIRVYKLGMSVGKDILGSMINTLLIAYVSASLPFLVLMTLAKFNNIHEFLNYDFVALELSRILIGAASIVLLIPITSVIASYLIVKKIRLF